MQINSDDEHTQEATSTTGGGGTLWEMLMEDDDDDDDSSTEEEQQQLLLASAAIAASNTCLEELSTRAPYDFVRNRLNWGQHAFHLVYEERFRRNYRMSSESFNKLCNMIRPVMQHDEEMSRRATGTNPITVEIMLHCLLRFLAGSSYHCIRIIAGISEPSFYRFVYRCAESILAIPELGYHFPTTEQELSTAASDFAEISMNNLIRGCVGCIDGLLLRITAPRARETANGRAYYSGHYRDFGINVQAVCDSNCRFIFAALAVCDKSTRTTPSDCMLHPSGRSASTNEFNCGLSCSFFHK